MSHAQLFVTPWTVARQALCPWGSPGKNTGVVTIFFFRGSSRTREQSCTSYIGRWILYHWATLEALNTQVANNYIHLPAHSPMHYFLMNSSGLQNSQIHMEIVYILIVNNYKDIYFREGIKR